MSFKNKQVFEQYCQDKFNASPELGYMWSEIKKLQDQETKKRKRTKLESESRYTELKERYDKLQAEFEKQDKTLRRTTAEIGKIHLSLYELTTLMSGINPFPSVEYD